MKLLKSQIWYGTWCWHTIASGTNWRRRALGRRAPPIDTTWLSVVPERLRHTNKLYSLPAHMHDRLMGSSEAITPFISSPSPIPSRNFTGEGLPWLRWTPPDASRDWVQHSLKVTTVFALFEEGRSLCFKINNNADKTIEGQNLCPIIDGSWIDEIVKLKVNWR